MSDDVALPPDAPLDAPTDASLDASLDAPLDAPTDASLDAPTDASLDAPADDAPAPAPNRRVWGTFGVVAVLMLAGILFTANARLAGGVDARQPQDLAGLVNSESDRAGTLQDEVDDLQAEVNALTDAQVTTIPGADAEQAELVSLAAGRVAVTGPGLTVKLWDAPSDVPRPSWVTNDYLVVHQQDLQAVINALWAGGAEAMSLQGERVISTSAFRCVGNVLRLHGQIYSPPYVVRAIGDPEKLMAALDASPEVLNYRDYVDAIGLGWSVDTESELELDAYTGADELRYATVPEDTE
jgi:uncharacterized protein YlxW (UPF0749 family)